MARGNHKLVETARVHHNTVTKLSKGETPRARRNRSTGPESLDVGFDSDTVDPRVWELARELSGGDFSRIEVESCQSLIVHNNANWRKQAESN